MKKMMTVALVFVMLLVSIGGCWPWWYGPGGGGRGGGHDGGGRHDRGGSHGQRH
ncbi:MAG: hypothetical protein JW943_17510 [Deltaproteobacteria bacterium]|nr:hypothetical protein [Deltaproteobacteria bacterium]